MLGSGEGIADLPSSVWGFCNQQDFSIAAAATSSSSHIPRIFPASFPLQEWQNQTFVHLSNAYQFPIPSNSIASNFLPQMIHVQNQDLGFRQPRNPTLVGEIHTGNRSRSQTMILGDQFESIPTPAQPNSIDWLNEVYSKISELRETIMEEVRIFYRRTQEKIQLATAPVQISRYECIRRNTELVMKFLGLSRAQMSRLPREIVYKSMNQTVRYYKFARNSNSVSRAAASFRLENTPVIPSAPFYQCQQLPGIDSRENNPNAKRMKGLCRNEKNTPIPFASGHGLMSQGKDFLSPATLPSDFLSPATPLSDIAKRPVPVESCRFAPSCSNSPLMEEPTCANPNPTEAGEQSEQSTDPIKRLVNAVKSMSRSNLKSAAREMYAITRLSDRVATYIVKDYTNIVNGEPSMKIIQRDLGDEITKFRMQEDKIEYGIGFCAKQLKMEEPQPREFLLGEIEEINQRSMELKVDVTNMDDVSNKEFDGEALIRFSYVPVGAASQQMASKFLLELTVPPSYPNSSLTVSDETLPSCCDFEKGDNLWKKAKSVFSLKHRNPGEKMTLKQLAKNWEDSAREVFLEYADRLGGGSLLRHGGWENLGVAV